MTLEHLRPQIKRALNNPDALSTSERVILSTLLFNNTYETAFKLRLSIRQIETALNDFKLKLKEATLWKNKTHTLDTSTHYSQKLFTPTPRGHTKTPFDTSNMQTKPLKSARVRHQPPKNNRSMNDCKSRKTLKTLKRKIKLWKLPKHNKDMTQ